MREEVAEVAAALLAEGPASPKLTDEIGDLLFAVVNVARMAGVDPKAALATATAKFGRRFQEVARLAKEQELPMPGTDLEALDRLWDRVKSKEVSGD